jgi:hypothetical protein
MPDGIDEILTIRLPTHPVNAEMRSGSPRPSHKCDVGLRGGIVKAAARRVERSESLDEAEHSLILAM